MRNMAGMRFKTILSIFVIVIICAYTIVAITPLSRSISRVNPKMASWFYPPFFTFAEVFTEGTVKSFEIGSNQVEILKLVIRTDFPFSFHDCETRKEIPIKLDYPQCYFIIFDDIERGVLYRLKIINEELFSITVIFWGNLDDVLLIAEVED